MCKSESVTLIHCTAKLLKELGSPTLQSPANEPDTQGLGNWYANLLRIDRRKCILFTNEKTLYSFLIPKVKKEKWIWQGSRQAYRINHENWKK